MAEIQAVLFDVGGVLLTNGWDHAEREAVLRKFSVDRGAYEMRHELANDAWEKGFTTVEQFLAATVFFEPRPFTPQEFFEGMKAQSKELDRGAMGVLPRLRSSGKLKLAILNNEAKELNNFRIDRFHLGRYFDAFLSSCYLGLRKPDPKIFTLALETLHRAGEETVFVDDREENCAAAESLGIHALRYRDPERLTQDLTRLGVSLC